MLFLVTHKLVECILSVCRDKMYGFCGHHQPSCSESMSFKPMLIENNDLSSGQNNFLSSNRANLVVGSFDNDQE